MRIKKKQYNHVKIYILRKRLLDMDNAIGGCKPLVDNLKVLGLIKDDDMKSVNIAYEQVKDDENMVIFELWNEKK